MIHYDLTHQPQLFGYTKRAEYEAATGKHTGFAKAGQEAMSGSASHWTTTYKAEVQETLNKEGTKSRPPMWSLPREAYSSGRSNFASEYNLSYGPNGHNPRNQLPNDSGKQSHAVHDLTMGTTQVTTHIPGYNGFIPKSDFNQHALQQSQLEAGKCRNTIVKQNIVENYQVKLPGYQGHKPMSTVNDKGVPRPHCLKTEGEAFHTGK